MALLAKIKSRYSDFKFHYRKLRNDGKEIYGENPVDIPLHSRYNVVNCIRWAMHNSKHYNRDWTYK